MDIEVHFCTGCVCLAAEKCYHDVLKQARAAVEADKVREELGNEISTGRSTATSCSLRVSNNNHVVHGQTRICHNLFALRIKKNHVLMYRILNYSMFSVYIA